MRPLLFLILLLLPLPAHAEKLRVVCSFSIVCDMVQAVTGDMAETTVLVGPDGNTHVYEPTPADARIIAQANLIIINGLGFEGWMNRLIAASGYKGSVVEATHGIDALELHGKHNGQGIHYDPHAWHSIVNAKIYVTNIRDALVVADVPNSNSYRANADAYLQELGNLDAWARGEINRIPLAKRKVITSHDAFRYLAREYGITFLAPQGSSALSYASAGDVARLIDEIRANRVTALFMESISDPRMMEQIRKDSGAISGGTLYADALSPPDGPAGTYLQLFRHNVTLLTNAMRHNPD